MSLVSINNESRSVGHTTGKLFPRSDCHSSATKQFNSIACVKFVKHILVYFKLCYSSFHVK